MKVSKYQPPPKRNLKSLLFEACFEFEVGNYFIKTKSGDSFKCSGILFIEDPEFGEWLRLENAWETTLWSETKKALPLKPGAIIELSLDSIESVSKS